MLVIVAASLYVALITYAALNASKGESHIVPEAFEHHDHVGETEINASENPIGWWLKATGQKLK